jgi:hypothetical protein
MASNIPLGTFLEDGVRTGPLYSGQIPASLLPFNPTLDLSYSSYSAYGPAVLLSTQNTWNITPAPTGIANVVARTNAIANINSMILTGDNSATKLISQSNTPTYTQFDWPRVPTVTISNANLTAPLRVTIFGFDWYGNPMQHTYVVQNIGTYPSGTTPAKAFYSVSQVSISGALTNGAFISVGASDVFGLPFVVNNAGDITSIGWGQSSDLQDNAGLLASPVAGTATLAAGTVTVPVNAVTAASNILISRNTPAGTLGNLSVPSASITANTSFVINSSSNAETSTVNWEIVNPLSQYSASGSPSAAMITGAVTIFTSQVQANSNIQLTMGTFGTAHGQWYVSAIVPGVSFTVTSTANTETSTVSWAIIPANWPSGTSNNLGSGVTPVAGQIFVPAPSVTASSNILLTYATNPAGSGGVLSAPTASIQPGVGFTIISSNNADTAQVNWAITNLVAGSTSGTSTLVAGTVTVATTGVAANSVILLSDNTLNTQSAYVRVSGRTAGTSFVITAAANTDISSINWAILPANFILPNTVSPLGVFTPADQTFPVTSTTGDVRGLYAPSTPSNGVNILRFTSYVQGADQWINQTANNQFVEASQGQPVVGTPIDSLNPQDLYGNPQFYTGSNS